MRSNPEKPLGRSGIGLLLLLHLVCCGVPLLIVIGGIGAGALFSWIADSLLPIAGVILLALSGWGGSRIWKNRAGNHFLNMHTTGER